MKSKLVKKHKLLSSSWPLIVMYIRRPRGVTVPQLMVVTVIGFLGGIYIWKPLLLSYKAQKEAKSVVSSEVSSTVKTESK